MKRFIAFRGLCIWPVSESRTTHYAEVCNQNGETVRDVIESPTFTEAEDAITEARAWIDGVLPAGGQAPRSWRQTKPQAVRS